MREIAILPQTYEYTFCILRQYSVWTFQKDVLLTEIHFIHSADLQHAIRFRPAQIMLDIRSSLRLNDETNQAQNQEPGRNEILATSGMLRFVFWASTADH